MDTFVIRGGAALTGHVSVGGAKNSALPIMAAALLASEPVELHSVPELVDVRTMCQLLNTLGVATQHSQQRLKLSANSTDQNTADYELVRRMRASICVLGPLLARRGKARVSLPGGCNIGDRPVDLHLKGLAALGADIRLESGYIVATASQLRGCRINLAGPFGSTVTGTCNVLMAATLARGTTVIDSAACEPEVVDLADALISMGARISGAGTSTLVVDGVDELSGTTHRVIPDRIEAATLMIAAAATRGDVIVENVCVPHLQSVIDILREAGVSVCEIARTDCDVTQIDVTQIDATQIDATQIDATQIDVTTIKQQKFGDRYSLRVTTPQTLRGVNCNMQPFPGLPTDVQAQLMALLTTVSGISTVTDRVFPDRFMHAAELVRLGAKIRREGNTAVVTGGSRLCGANVMASDLRASAALVIAGLAAEGETVIRRIYHLDRGYERLESKLSALGACIQRSNEKSLTQSSIPVPNAAPIPAPHIAAAMPAETRSEPIAASARFAKTERGALAD